MDASLLITEAVINDGMSALVAEINADETVTTIIAGEHWAFARIDTRVIVADSHEMGSHPHTGEEEAMICFALKVRSLLDSGLPIIALVGDDAAIRARAASARDDQVALWAATLQSDGLQIHALNLEDWIQGQGGDNAV